MSDLLLRWSQYPKTDLLCQYENGYLSQRDTKLRRICIGPRGKRGVFKDSLASYNKNKHLGGGLMKLMAKTVACAVAAFAVSGCGGGSDALPKPAPVAAPASAPKPLDVVDVSTPDKAMKAYWAQRDAINAGWPAVKTSIRAQLDGLMRGMKAVTTAGMAADEIYSNSPPESFERDIVEVKVESESRAVVLAVIKNTTPIPAGADLTSRDEKQRREGDRYRYVLEREKDGWKVAEVWERDILDRTPWRKAMPFDRKPQVQTDTYQGR